MEFELGFGRGVQKVTVPDKNLADVLTQNRVSVGLTGEAEVRRALRSPIGTPELRKIVRPGEKIAIVTSDITRPMPSRQVLPAILEELEQAGADMKDVTVVFGLGIHRHQTEEEMRRLVGDRVYETVRCVDSDVHDCVHMGTTSRGTPVDIFRPVAEADRRVLLGNIEYHYFAGYSGGAKALMPGVSTRAAIQANHARMVEETSRAGNLDTNALRADIEEAGRICGADFILNVVLSEQKEILRAVAGDLVEAHRAGCAFLDTLYRRRIRERADIVITSQGGAPKDLNLYQTQKALDNAKHAVKKGGTIIVVGSCREGFGESVFEEWIAAAPDARSLIDRVRRDFRLGGHKAAAIAMVLENADIVLVSEMPEETVRAAFLTPAASAQEALDAALAKYGPDATVIVMPHGGSTLPETEQS